MLPRSTITTIRQLITRSGSRSYATASSPKTLVYLEHVNGNLESGSLSALTAASQLGGEVTGILVGGSSEVQSVLEKAKK
jgi:electron transfer flavoprotein alpha subunit